MKSATLFAAIAFTALAGGAYAQDTTGTTTTGATAPGTPTTTAPAAGAPATGMNGPATPADHNQAVATTAADTATPAKGANSFTKKQAAHRIRNHHFTQVKDLTKDDNGVWHGTAMQNGSPVKVWEDYKGSVGTE
ncbi:hypothetical protein [Lichenicola sp.]|uniref:hypothetical protein n=1 Tax=Lichenicola sp. TaxID=2804529 RepID=UPI003AFF8162